MVQAPLPETYIKKHLKMVGWETNYFPFKGISQPGTW